MLADVVSYPDRMHADLLRGSLADQSLAAMAQRRLAHRFLNEPGQMQGRAAGRILLEAVVPLEDLHVKASAAQRFRRLANELHEEIDRQTHVRRLEQGRLVGRFFDFFSFRGAMPGCRDDYGDAAL